MGKSKKFTSEEIAKTHFPSPIDEKLFKASSKKEKKEKIAFHFREIMKTLGLDLKDPSLKKTPERVASMFVSEIFSGLDYNAFPKIAKFDVKKHSSVVFTEVSLVSFCEHHFVPMIGKAYVAYMPRGKVLGLSKISRIVRYFAARPQLQERLTSQVGDSLSKLLGHDDVAVCVIAQHTCVMARGAKDESAKTTTFHCTGIFGNTSEHRKEFLDLIWQYE
jgi:GTP cyclohydrolase IA